MAKITVLCDLHDPAEKGEVFCDGVLIGIIEWDRENNVNVDILIHLLPVGERIAEEIKKLVRRHFESRYWVRSIEVRYLRD